MPIRFRCAYCNQLMGIARRKAGSVVRCPKCSGQVVVPIVAASDTPPPPGPSRHLPPTQGGGLFDKEDFSQLLRREEEPPNRPAPPQPLQPPRQGLNPEILDVEPVGGPIQISGIFLTPSLLTLAGVLIILLMGAAFFAGWMMGRF